MTQGFLANSSQRGVGLHRGIWSFGLLKQNLQAVWAGTVVVLGGQAGKGGAVGGAVHTLRHASRNRARSLTVKGRASTTRLHRHFFSFSKIPVHCAAISIDQVLFQIIFIRIHSNTLVHNSPPPPSLYTVRRCRFDYGVFCISNYTTTFNIIFLHFLGSNGAVFDQVLLAMLHCILSYFDTRFRKHCSECLRCNSFSAQGNGESSV